MHHRRLNAFAPACLALATLVSALLAAPAAAQQVTRDGWAEAAAGLEFYLDVPMIDNSDLARSGVGGNITAEAIINAVRYADRHPQIHHVVFRMDTGGGSLMHAEAMEDAIERHHANTEFHIVVQNAISAGIWTAFSCDTIFMCTAGTIGGATAYYQIGDQSIVAGDIPYIAARLERTAERNGYPKQLIKPLMLMDSELHAWKNDAGKPVLSNTPPKDRDAVTGYRHLDQKNTVLTLTTSDAVALGIAQKIEAFDAQLVGKKIGVPGWTRANRFGQILDEIGYVYNITRVMEDQWVEKKLALPRFPLTTYNRNNRMIKDMMRTRRQHEDVLEALRSINQSLDELPGVHPERHIYLPGPDKKTLVADPERWERDAQEAAALGRRLAVGLEALIDAYEDLEIDKSNLEHIDEPIRTIASRTNRIRMFGNAAYWENEAE